MTRFALAMVLSAGLCVSCASPSSPSGPANGPVLSGAADATGASRGPGGTLAPPDRATEKSAGPDPIPWRSGNVVVELFSSEGCSSCPPADAVLRELSEQKEVEGAHVIALEMHVDYWNDLGWVDPFSSEVYTSRQRAYTSALGDRSPYTPQMVVDGRKGFVGSDRGAARSAIKSAVRVPKAKVELSLTGDRGSSEENLSIKVGELPGSAKLAHVLLALSERGLQSQVTRGENAGSLLVHAPVVRSLTRIGTIPSGAEGKGWGKTVPLKLSEGHHRDRMHAVVIVQAADSLAILGAAETPLGT